MNRPSRISGRYSWPYVKSTFWYVTDVIARYREDMSGYHSPIDFVDFIIAQTISPRRMSRFYHTQARRWERWEKIDPHRYPKTK